MSNFFDKEDVENIKILNECSEMKHRYKPLDLNNADD